MMIFADKLLVVINVLATSLAIDYILQVFDKLLVFLLQTNKATLATS